MVQEMVQEDMVVVVMVHLDQALQEQQVRQEQLIQVVVQVEIVDQDHLHLNQVDLE